MSDHELVFDRASHSADAIQRAVYRLSEQLSCELVEEGPNYKCRLQLLGSVDDVATVLAEFKNEVIDQVLRERIRRETEDVRNLVLALAFANTGLSAD